MRQRFCRSASPLRCIVENTGFKTHNIAGVDAMGTLKHTRPLLVALIIVIILCAFSTPANAQINSTRQAGTSSAAFLKIGVGARAMSMGGAFVAVADDATAGYWNSAGLAQLSSTEVLFMHSSLYQDINLEHFCVGFPVSNSIVLGIGATYLDYGSFEGYDLNNQPSGSYSANAMVLSSSAGIGLTDRLSVGITGKVLSEKLDRAVATGYALDLGALYTTGAVSLGIQMSNIGTGLKYETEQYPLPTSISAGIAMSLLDNRLRIATDLSKPNDNAVSIHQGLEYCYENTIFMRTGYSHRFADLETSQSTGMAFGAGIRHSAGEIDYSYVPDDKFGDMHRVGFRLRFGGTD